ncbi:hypothetical protein QVD17_25581 [Tagetes erecta]|uniref:Uncharacterized protein n=1 Tax=Tagetes erecta TaxID=13708 RepID=A0AAD8KJ56_TARER|nr:hypothetical protein QVD17_25581 [Tagetes erecta]
MATSLSTCFHPISFTTNRFNRIKPPAASSSSSGKWWTPIFNLSPDPDYIHSQTTETDDSATQNLDPDNNARSRFAPGCFTEEKAKQMRMKTIETANFHDVMYHSAIASRLASDVSGRYDR